MTEVFERKKWTNKANVKQEVADSLIHNTTCYIHVCIKFQIPRLCIFCKIIDKIFHIQWSER